MLLQEFKQIASFCPAMNKCVELPVPALYYLLAQSEMWAILHRRRLFFRLRPRNFLKTSALSCTFKKVLEVSSVRKEVIPSRFPLPFYTFLLGRVDWKKNVSSFLIFWIVVIFFQCCSNSGALWVSNKHRFPLCVCQSGNNMNCVPESEDKDVFTVG
jgi:hypothetical protein